MQKNQWSTEVEWYSMIYIRTQYNELPCKKLKKNVQVQQNAKK